MSALEAIGLVIGVTTLVISAVENRSALARLATGFSRKERRKQLDKTRREISFFRECFKIHVETMLRPILRDDEARKTWLDDPQGGTWPAGLESRFQKFHKSRLKVCMEILERMHGHLEELKRDLAIGDEQVEIELAKASSTTGGATIAISRKPYLDNTKKDILNLLSRWKLNFNEKKRDDIYEELKICNENLNSLLKNVDYNVQSRTTVHHEIVESKSLRMIGLDKIFDKASSFFMALSGAWDCACQDNHAVNLKLEHRQLDPSNPRAQIWFEIVLIFLDAPNAERAWRWQELICGQQHGSCPSIRVFSDQSTCAKSCLDLRPQKSVKGNQGGKRKQVGFVEPMDEDHANDLNLCRALELKLDDCLGLVKHGDEKYHLHPCSNISAAEDSSSVSTLEYLLSRANNDRLNRLDRCAIALHVASSTVQLHPSPWLKATALTKVDILFYKSKRFPTISSAGEPFIRRHFERDDNDTSYNQVVPGAGVVQSAENKFHSLGLILLELCFDSSREDQPEFQRLVSSPATRTSTQEAEVGLAWMERIGEDDEECYYEAIEWCFKPKVYHGNKWRRLFVRHVVEPLHRSYTAMKYTGQDMEGP